MPDEKIYQVMSDSCISDVVTIVTNAVIDGKKIFAIGNGGSLSIAEHFISDLVKGADKGVFIPMTAECLGSNQVELTAEVNDNGSDSVFTNMLKRRIITKGDVLFSFSVSGNSPNIVSAKNYANDVGMTLVTLVGLTHKVYTNEILIEASTNQENSKCDYGNVESVFSYFCHQVAESVRKRLREYYGI
jgi:phosphoheptose isomerase